MNYEASTLNTVAPRYTPIKKDISIQAKNTGAQLGYKLNLEDISTTGILVSWGYECSIPFMENSVVCFTIEGDQPSIDKPIHFMGHVARVFYCCDTGKVKFGVQIINLEGLCVQEWERMIQKIASLNGMAS